MVNRQVHSLIQQLWIRQAEEDYEAFIPPYMALTSFFNITILFTTGIYAGNRNRGNPVYHPRVFRFDNKKFHYEALAKHATLSNIKVYTHSTL